MLLLLTIKPPIFSIRGGLTKNRFFMRGEIEPPSKLIVTNMFSPQGGGLLLGGGLLSGGSIEPNNIFFYEGGNRASVKK